MGVNGVAPFVMPMANAVQPPRGRELGASGAWSIRDSAFMKLSFCKERILETGPERAIVATCHME